MQVVLVAHRSSPRAVRPDSPAYTRDTPGGARGRQRNFTARPRCAAHCAARVSRLSAWVACREGTDHCDLAVKRQRRSERTSRSRWPAQSSSRPSRADSSARKTRLGLLRSCSESPSSRLSSSRDGGIRYESSPPCLAESTRMLLSKRRSSSREEVTLIHHWATGGLRTIRSTCAGANAFGGPGSWSWFHGFAFCRTWCSAVLQVFRCGEVTCVIPLPES